MLRLVKHPVLMSPLALALWSASLCAQDFDAPPVAFPANDAREVSPSSRIFAATETIAIVGDQHILAGELLGQIDQMLAPYKGKVPEEEFNAQRQLLMKQMLPAMVENKILYLEFLRKIPRDKLGEIQQRLYDEFDEQKLEPAMGRAKVNSPAELDQMLRANGSSLEKQRRAYMEQTLGRSMMWKDINRNPDITHDEMLDYYRDHATEFDIQAKAKWEQLSVRLSNHNSPEEAWAKIAEMGNEVLRGAKFEAVAKKHSEAPSAAEGGQNDYVTKGSLASEPLDNAIFTLPTGQLSQIIIDDKGFHIIRVIERQDATRVEFVSAQGQIKEKLAQQKREKQIEAFVNNLKAKTSVWTIYDDEPPATPTASTAKRRQDDSSFIPR